VVHWHGEIVHHGTVSIAIGVGGYGFRVFVATLVDEGMQRS
jgi:hypothetical protein